MRRWWRDERGVSLVEMVTVMALLGVVLTGTFAALSSMQTATVGVDERIENLTETRIVMGTITQDIRTATRPPHDPDSGSPFEVATTHKLTFYANFRTTDGKPRKVTIDASDGVLREHVAEPQGALPYTYGAASERLVGGYVNKSVPLFHYLDTTRKPIDPGPDGVLTDQQRLDVASIEVDLRVRRDPNPRAPETVVRTTVRLPNLSPNRP